MLLAAGAAWLGVGSVLATLCVLYLTRWQIAYTSDTAMIGLMAKSILERGERPIFVWSVGYQGVALEAYLTALFFAWRGVGPTVMCFASAVSLWLGLGVWCRVVARAFDGVTALLTAALIVLSMPLFYQLNLRPLPNFPEALLLGSLSLFFFVRAADAVAAGHTPLRRDLMLLGLCMGFGMYTFAITAYFHLAIAGACILGFRWLHPQEARVPLRLAKIMRWLAVLLACIGLAVLVINPPPFPFRGRLLPWNPLGLLILGAACATGPRLVIDGLSVFRRSLATRKALATFTVGLVVGYGPALWFKLVLGGSSVKTATASGGLKEIGVRLDVLQHFLGEAWRFGLDAPWPLVWVCGVAHAVCVAWFSVTAVRAKWPLPRLALGLMPLVIVPIFLTSKAVVDIYSSRYAIFLVPPCSLAVAWAIRSQWPLAHRMTRAGMAAGLALTMGLGGREIARDLQNVPDLPYAAIEREMTALGLTHGYANYWLAYATMLVANERVILEPIFSAYAPHYRNAVRAQTRIAYVDFDPPRLAIQNGRLTIAKGEDQTSYEIEQTRAVPTTNLQLRVLRRLPYTGGSR